MNVTILSNNTSDLKGRAEQQFRPVSNLLNSLILDSNFEFKNWKKENAKNRTTYSISNKAYLKLQKIKEEKKQSLNSLISTLIELEIKKWKE